MTGDGNLFWGWWLEFLHWFWHCQGDHLSWFHHSTLWFPISPSFVQQIWTYLHKKFPSFTILPFYCFEIQGLFRLFWPFWGYKDAWFNISCPLPVSSRKFSSTFYLMNFDEIAIIHGVGRIFFLQPIIYSFVPNFYVIPAKTVINPFNFMLSCWSLELFDSEITLF